MNMAHEDLSREQYPEASSDRVFGLVFAGLFVLFAFAPLRHGLTPRWWALGIALVFGASAVLRPTLLSAPNRLWTKLGALLGKVLSPVALAVLFYGVLTPVGTLMRLSGKDPLRLRLDPEADSYWIGRVPPGPPPDSMHNQF